MWSCGRRKHHLQAESLNEQDCRACYRVCNNGRERLQVPLSLSERGKRCKKPPSGKQGAVVQEKGLFRETFGSFRDVNPLSVLPTQM